MYSKLLPFLWHITLGILIGGCDKIESITQSDFDLEITTKTATIDQSNNTFSTVDSVDLSANQTFKDNKTRIKGLKIDEVLMTLHATSGNKATLLQTASANISKLDGSEDTNLGSLNSASIAALDGVETPLC